MDFRLYGLGILKESDNKDILVTFLPWEMGELCLRELWACLFGRLGGRDGGRQPSRLGSATKGIREGVFPKKIG